MRNFTVFVAALLLFAAHARADAISPPPTTCVDGSMGVLCHGPPRCAPSTCTADADCASGHVCRPQPLCLETISCGGITTTMDPNVTGTCLTGHCAAGGTCTTEMVCVPSASPIDDPHPLDAPAPVDAPSSDAPSATDAPSSSDAPAAVDAGATRSAGGCCSVGGATDAPHEAALLVTVALALAVARRKMTQRRARSALN